MSVAHTEDPNWEVRFEYESDRRERIFAFDTDLIEGFYTALGRANVVIDVVQRHLQVGEVGEALQAIEGWKDGRP